MGTRIHPRISYELARKAFYIACGFSLLFSFGYLLADFYREEKSVVVHARQLLNNSRSSLLQATYTLDQSLARQVGQDLVSTNGFLAVRIVDELGQDLSSSYQKTIPSSYTFWLTNLLTEPVVTISMPLNPSSISPRAQGIVSVLFNKDAALQNFYHRSVGFFILETVKNILLSLCLFFLFYFLVSLPLLRLAHRFRMLSLKHSEFQPLNMRNYREEHELGHLIHCCNELMDEATFLLASKEKQLQTVISNERSLRSIIDRLPYMIYVKDCNNLLILVNRKFALTYGSSIHEIEGQPYTNFEFLMEDNQKEFLLNDKDLFISGKKDLILELELKGANKEVSIQEIHKIPFQYHGERVLLCAAVDVTQRVKSREKIQHMAFHDALTDLPNRNLFMDRLYQATAHAERLKLFGALLFVDLDNFKQVNDTLGHSYGDDVIRNVGSRLLESVRVNDTVARLGGDEFVVVLQTLDGSKDDALDKAMQIADQLRIRLAEPHHLGSHKMEVTASIGVVLFPESGKDVKELLHHADTAMYHAKMGGRDSQVTFKDEMEDLEKRHHELENALREAVDHQNFSIVFQPEFDNVSHEVMGFEALLRWYHGRMGYSSPEMFIPILESTGLLITVGQWLLEHCCRCWQHLQQANLWQEHWRLHINISASQIMQSAFIDEVSTLLRNFDIPKGVISFDLTEEVVQKDLKVIYGKMVALNELGVEFSIDHFGQGSASISHLSQLPIQHVKVDQVLMSQLSTEKKGPMEGHRVTAQQMLASIILTAQHLGLGVTAVGIENNEQLEFLNSLHCDRFQGFLKGKPLSMDEMIEFIQSLNNSQKNTEMVDEVQTLVGQEGDS